LAGHGPLTLAVDAEELRNLGQADCCDFDFRSNDVDHATEIIRHAEAQIGIPIEHGNGAPFIDRQR